MSVHFLIQHLLVCIKVDGSWSLWGNWSECSTPCNGGNQQRTRICNNPPPANGGRQCIGLGIETQSCNNQTCPGKYSIRCFFCHESVFFFHLLAFSLCLLRYLYVIIISWAWIYFNLGTIYLLISHWTPMMLSAPDIATILNARISSSF